MSRKPATAKQWMPLHLDSWRRNTRRMSPLERCAYMDILIEYWDAQKALEVDHDDFANIVGISREQWDEISDRVLRYFFIGEDGMLHNKRIDEEIAKANRMLEQKREAGRKGGLSKGSSTKEAGAKAGATANATEGALQAATEAGTHPRGYRHEGETDGRSVVPMPLQISGDDEELDSVISGIERKARRSLAGKEAANQVGKTDKLRGVS